MNEDRTFGAVIHDHPDWEVEEVHAYTPQEARQMRNVFQFFALAKDGSRVQGLPIKVELQQISEGHIRDWETWWGLTNEYGHAEFVHPNKPLRYVVTLGTVTAEFGDIVWDNWPIITNLRTDIGAEEGEEPREYYRPGGYAGPGTYRAVNPPWRYRVRLARKS